MVQELDGPVRQFSPPSRSFQFHHHSSPATARLIVWPTTSPTGRRYFRLGPLRLRRQQLGRPRPVAHPTRLQRKDPRPHYLCDAETLVTLTCSFGGSIRPAFVWMKDGHLLQSTFEDGQVQLLIPSVRREDQCKASNQEDVDDAAQASVQLVIGAFPLYLIRSPGRSSRPSLSSASHRALRLRTVPGRLTGPLCPSPKTIVSDVSSASSSNSRRSRWRCITLKLSRYFPVCGGRMSGRWVFFFVVVGVFGFSRQM